MSQNDKVQREVLPIPDITPVGLTTYDARDPDTKYPPITPISPPVGAPNVLVILLDDVGFGASSAFGGPCYTPTCEKLAANGLKYTRFHTTALCAPTRAALLTGRNHHTVGMGTITETATSAPGYNSLRPNTCAPLALTLKYNGYSTAQFGKCHEVPVWQTSPVGPFDNWPTGSGFEYFYGFIGGETHQYYPALYEGTTPVEPPKTPEEGYHLTEDLADKAILYARQQKAIMGEKPFFIYFAPGATHAPHHVPKAYIDKYKGKFDQGYEKLREEIFVRQKQLGVISQDAELTPFNEDVPRWDSWSPDMKQILSRQMEIYAAFLEHTDDQVGRLIDAIADLGILDNTLIYFIIGDNGASAEGSFQGSFSELAYFNGLQALENEEFLKEHIDLFGGPQAYNHYSAGWAHALCTPYQWTKQVASHWGGTRNGTIVHWPNGIKGKGELRHQFAHVIDVAKTVLEVAGIPEPKMVNGILQKPLEGFSMVNSFNDANTPEFHETQYFEMFGNRGLYHKGWVAVTLHKAPWDGKPRATFTTDEWELYDSSTDWTQCHNIAQKHPDVLARLQQLWLIEATKYNVLPLDDRSVERMSDQLAGRPRLIQGNKQILYQGMERITEGTVLNMKNKSSSITAEIELPEGAMAKGVIFAQGGNTGGYSLYAHDGKLKYYYNTVGLRKFFIESNTPIPSGKHQVRMEFKYDGGGLGKGGDVTLFLDGQAISNGRIDLTVAMVFSADETADVGKETGSPVSPDYGPRDNEFNGVVNWVQLEAELDDHNHLISPQERLNIAMAIH